MQVYHPSTTLLQPTHCWVILDPHRLKYDRDLSHPTPLGVSLKVIQLEMVPSEVNRMELPACTKLWKCRKNLWQCETLALWGTPYYCIQFLLPGKDRAHIWMILMVHTLCWAPAYPPADVNPRFAGGSSRKRGACFLSACRFRLS